ncbi:MAG: hypothetical protein IH594_11165 [Bacteroidales bacterium]|nr:hypothetical protein [Bacteroidales bacterium]
MKNPVTGIKAFITFGLLIVMSFSSPCQSSGFTGSGDENLILTTMNGKPFAAVIDIFPQLCLGRYSPEQVEKNIALLAELGIKRIYFVVCLPGFPSFSNPWLALLPPGNDCDNFALESVIALESPNHIFCRYAKKYGMEAFAILKPYEGGGGATIPADGKLFWEAGGRHDCVGGDRIHFDTFLARHPEFRVQRKPVPNYEQDVAQAFQRVELAFYLDDIPATRQVAAAPAAPANYRCEDFPVEFKLWASEDNGSYVVVDENYKQAERIEYRFIYDIYGKLLFPEKKRCRVVEFTDLDLPLSAQYLAVSLHGDPEHIRRLQTIPSSMFSVSGPLAPVPFSTSTYSRQGVSPSQIELLPGERQWGMEAHPRQGRMDFMNWGFEFDWYGAGIWFGDGWQNRAVYGIGRGKIMTMKGTHCEAYPEVRAYWLEQVQTLIDMGYDGVDIRLQNHSSMISDIASFGFNLPLIERYRETYHTDPMGEDFDPMKMMAVRGQFFQEFLGDAADLLHRNGRKLQVHLRHAHQEPKLRSDFNELGFWAMPKIWLEDWKGVVDLADEVTIKDYYWGNYNPDGAIEIKKYAHDSGKAVWIHNYIGQGDAIRSEFINAVAEDPTVSGILLYEAFHSGKESNEPNQGLIIVAGEKVSYHQPAVEALKSVSKLSPVK